MSGTSSRIHKCAQERCPKLRVLGSRCVRHWMKRQKAYKLFPHNWLWWKILEPTLIAGIEMRADGLSAGAPEVKLPYVGERYRKHIEELVNRACEIADRRHNESGAGSEEEAG